MNDDLRLGVLESTILMAVLHCGQNAYGLTIQNILRDRIERTLTLGAIYTTLERLERKRLVSSRIEKGLPSRGGRPRRVFTVESAGLASLAAVKQDWDALFAGLNGVLASA